MNYYNEGSFVAKTMEDIAQLVTILNKADLSPDGYDPDDATKQAVSSVWRLENVTGISRHRWMRLRIRSSRQISV